ncbi:alpha/beta fold hydrolase [Halomonas sp. E19]|uniref:alpha/beta fold hydrolase n=1 Tax=Halomonas sp. E19 TaxID=3397247 RepID=UPI004034DF49
MRLLLSGLFEHPAVFWLMLRDYVRMNVALGPELRGMMADAIETRLPGLTQPVMLVRGGRDLLVPAKWFLRAARLTDAAQVVQIPGRGHAVHISAAERLVQALRSFLLEGKLPSGTAGKLSGGN